MRVYYAWPAGTSAKRNNPKYVFFPARNDAEALKKAAKRCPGFSPVTWNLIHYGPIAVTHPATVPLSGVERA